MKEWTVLQDFLGTLLVAEWKAGEGDRDWLLTFIQRTEAQRPNLPPAVRGTRFHLKFLNQTVMGVCSVVSSISSAGHVLPYALVRF